MSSSSSSPEAKRSLSASASASSPLPAAAAAAASSEDREGRTGLSVTRDSVSIGEGRRSSSSSRRRCCCCCCCCCRRWWCWWFCRGGVGSGADLVVWVTTSWCCCCCFMDRWRSTMAARFLRLSSMSSSSLRSASSPKRTEEAEAEGETSPASRSERVRLLLLFLLDATIAAGGIGGARGGGERGCGGGRPQWAGLCTLVARLIRPIFFLSLSRRQSDTARTCFQQRGVFNSQRTNTGKRSRLADEEISYDIYSAGEGRGWLVENELPGRARRARASETPEIPRWMMPISPLLSSGTRERRDATDVRASRERASER